jgi:hypothetical protein
MAKQARKNTKRTKSTGSRTKRAKATRAKTAKRSTGRRWSQRVTEQSDALDLKGGVFTLKDPKRIAASLKRSALSMLTFYLNRAGKTLPASRKRTLERAKDELREQFGRA